MAEIDRKNLTVKPEIIDVAISHLVTGGGFECSGPCEVYQNGRCPFDARRYGTFDRFGLRFSGKADENNNPVCGKCPISRGTAQYIAQRASEILQKPPVPPSPLNDSHTYVDISCDVDIPNGRRFLGFTQGLDRLSNGGYRFSIERIYII